MSQAVCRPQDATQDSPVQTQQKENVYIYGDAKIILADDTSISGAEFIHKDQEPKVSKSKAAKKAVAEKPKLVPRKIKTKVVSKPAAPPVEFVTSKDPIHSLGGGVSTDKHYSITTTSTLKLATTSVNFVYCFIVIPQSEIAHFSYQQYSNKTLLFGHHFQRPPPSVA